MNCVLDDSGGYSQTEFISIAGYVATDEQWGSFSDDWKALLVKHGIPCIHMRTLVPLKGAYRELGWDVTKRDAVLSEFIELIRKHVLAGFAIAFDAKHYRSMSADAKERIGNPHRFCLVRTIRLIQNTFARVGAEDAITLVFDDSEELSVMYHGNVRELRKDPKYKKLIGSVCFSDDEIYNPLQAADVLAWETTKDLSQKLGGFKSRPDYEKLLGLDQPPITLPYLYELYGAMALEDAYKKSATMTNETTWFCGG
jgi:hypothetical protein